jgi:segregation and condensation protein B
MEPLEVNELEQEGTPAENERPSEEAASLTAGTETTGEATQVEEIITAEMIVEAPPGPDEDAQFKALIEAAIYITDEPLTPAQIAAALGQPAERINRLLDDLTAEYNKPERGLSIREIAGGFKMSTKPEHHEAIRAFVKNLKPPLKLSLPALETLAVIAYKQPVTAPEIMEIRGVQGVGVLKTLLDRKLIATSGRKQVIGKPILYKTTKDFLVQFGLKDLSELPTLKEFEELGRLALSDTEEPLPTAPAEPVTTEEPADSAPETPNSNEPGPQPQPVKAEQSASEEPGKEPAA